LSSSVQQIGDHFAFCSPVLAFYCCGEGHGDNTWLEFASGHTVQYIVEGIDKAAQKMTKGWS